MTLYRKYRPKNFSEMVGREPIVNILKEEIRESNIANAYLFSGTRGTGKTSMARLFAKALNCENYDSESGEPCNQCPSCKAIIEGRSQDLVEIDAASNRGIDEIRQLREHVQYVPSSSKYKVYVIDEAHMLTKEAFNALLKTLEEPPSHVVFILATTELHKIMETIFSRCQHFSFSKLSLEVVIKRINHIASLENVELEESVARDIARRSGGSMRDAESLLGQILSIGSKKIISKDVEVFLPKVGYSQTSLWIRALIEKDSEKALKILDELEQDGVNLVFFIDEALETARQMMLYSATRDFDRLKIRFTPDQARDIADMNDKADTLEIRKIVVELLRASQDMKLSVDIPSLPLEIAVVLICQNSEKQDTPEAQTENKQISAEQKNPVSNSINTEETIKKVKNENKNASPENPPKELKQEDVQNELNGSNHSLEDILDGWGEVLAKVKDKNQALNFVLGVAQPVGISGGKIELGFKYRLHQEKVCEFKNRSTVEKIVKEVYGSNYAIEPVLKEKIELQDQNSVSNKPESAAEEEEEDELVKTALRVFEGAEIIN